MNKRVHIEVRKSPAINPASGSSLRLRCFCNPTVNKSRPPVYNLSARTHKLEDLRPGRVYDVWIRAVNAAGPGEKISRKFTTKEREDFGTISLFLLFICFVFSVPAFVHKLKVKVTFIDLWLSSHFVSVLSRCPATHFYHKFLNSSIHNMCLGIFVSI